MQSNLNTNDRDASSNAEFIIVDIEAVANGKQGRPSGDPGLVIRYRIKIDETFFEVENHKITGLQLLALAKRSSDDFDLFQVLKDGPKSKEDLIKPNEKVDLDGYGIERFITKAKTYKFSIGKKEYETPSKILSVLQILEDYAKVNPADKTLARKEGGGFHEYKDLNEKVSMLDHPKFTLFDNTPTQVS